jgi:hypothetical protein
MLIIPFVTLFFSVSLNAATPIKVPRSAQTLEALQPLFTLLEKKLNLPLKITVVNESVLDVLFKTTKTNALVTIKENVLSEFTPEIIEVVIAARVARWIASTSRQKSILSACQNATFLGGATTLLSSLFIVRKWHKTRILSFELEEKYALAGLALVGSALLAKLILESHIKQAEAELTKELIASPSAHAFLSSLSTNSRTLLASQESLRFLSEKFRQTA